MKRIFVLINHILTQRQINELKITYGQDCQFIFPPQDIKDYWAQIPPTTSLDPESIFQIVKWLSQSEKDDILLVQGDFGATFMIADYALQNGLIPIQSVTKRIEHEERDGEKVYKHYVFEHECFRKYKKYSELK